jgi:hypothetical protein
MHRATRRVVRIAPVHAGSVSKMTGNGRQEKRAGGQSEEIT